MLGFITYHDNNGSRYFLMYDPASMPTLDEEGLTPYAFFTDLDEEGMPKRPHANEDSLDAAARGAVPRSFAKYYNTTRVRFCFYKHALELARRDGHPTPDIVASAHDLERLRARIDTLRTWHARDCQPVPPNNPYTRAGITAVTMGPQPPEPVASPVMIDKRHFNQSKLARYHLCALNYLHVIRVFKECNPDARLPQASPAMLAVHGVDHPTAAKLRGWKCEAKPVAFPWLLYALDIKLEPAVYFWIMTRWVRDVEAGRQ